MGIWNGEGFTMRNFIILYIQIWAMYVTGMGEGRSAFKLLTGKPTRKR